MFLEKLFSCYKMFENGEDGGKIINQLGRQNYIA